MVWQEYIQHSRKIMRPYIPGEDLTGISVNKEDTPEAGGYIARNPDNHADQWYVSPAYFAKNIVPVNDATVSFGERLAQLLNAHSLETASNTPDFILASYLQGCLDNFNHTLQWRARWWGPGQAQEEMLAIAPEPSHNP
jgi:hypothetical protein